MPSTAVATGTGAFTSPPLGRGCLYAAVVCAAILRLDTGFEACALAASALFCAHRFRCASRIALLPATDNLRFGLGASAGANADGSDPALIRAHLALWASAIFRRDSALNRLRFGAVLPGELVSLPGLESIARNSAIWASI